MLTNTWSTDIGTGTTLLRAFQFWSDEALTVPYDISGLTWEYTVHAAATDAVPLFTVTQTPGAAGVLTVTTSPTLAQVALTLNPAATTGRAPAQFAHALWSNPATTTAMCWMQGYLTLNATAQP